MSEKEPPVPPPGRVFVLFKKPGAKNFSANIVFPGGISEVFDTGESSRLSANAQANGRIRALQKEHNIETAAQYKARTHSQLSVSAIRVALAQGKVPDESTVRTRKLIPDDDALEDSEPEEEERPSNWARDLVRIENKFTMGFQRIVALLLLGQDRDPARFLDHVRAIVTEVTLSGLTPTGRLAKKRGPYKKREED